jgi:hypothetical protein
VRASIVEVDRDNVVLFSFDGVDVSDHVES